MNKYNHEPRDARNQHKRFFAVRLRECLGGAWVRQQLTYVTTLFTMTVLLFATMGDAWARPLLATAPGLGVASSFAILGASTVTNTGPTVVTGDLGVSPGSAVTGFPPGIVVGGTIHAADAVAAQAQADATVAYNNLAGQACDTDKTGQDLGGQTLTTGVYCFNTSAQLTGILTLDGQGDPNAVFIFKIGSTLTTASASSVLLINGASACNVFWQVGSSATLGTGTTFVGTIIALASNTLTTGVSLSGRAIALTGAVTMDTNTISTAGCAAPPTSTPTATDTLVPSTNTPTLTLTPVLPTSTPTATNTLMPSTSIPTLPPTSVPTTSTPTATLTPVATTPVPIPEPITVVLFGTGLATLFAAVAARRRLK